jgi:hypothetical protein
LVYVAIVVGSLTQIEGTQERRKLSPEGTKLPPISCASLATAFGMDGVHVETAKGGREAAAQAGQASRKSCVPSHSSCWARPWVSSAVLHGGDICLADVVVHLSKPSL